MVSDQDRPDKNKKSGGTEDSTQGQLGLSEALKKLVTVGIGAAFMTEESIRNYVGEMKLPKEALGLLLQGAAKSKDELMNKVGNEMIKMLSKIDFVKEASRFVEDHKFSIKAEVEVTKKEKKD
jgi:hypothetical protein